MALRVVGAGLGRTGTNSLKLALEELLEGRCYHMLEAIERPRDTEVWQRALDAEPVDWRGFLGGYVATVDWPACAFWRELADANPDARILLSTRASAAEWWESIERTIFAVLAQPVPDGEPEWAARRAMNLDLMERLDPRWRDQEAAIAAYERHNRAVRAQVPSDRLIDWTVGDGWEPICAALGVPVPTKPFPHANTAAEFRADRVVDEAGGGAEPSR